MALIATTTASADGNDLAGAAAAGGGDTFTNTGAELYVVKNADGTSTNVTFVTSATVDGQSVGDRVVAVAAGVTKSIGPFQRWVYGSTVSVTYSKVTSLTVTVLKVSPVGA